MFPQMSVEQIINLSVPYVLGVRLFWLLYDMGCVHVDG